MTGLASYTRILISIVDADGGVVATKEHGPIDGWAPLNVADDRVLWAAPSGRISLWTLDDRGNCTGYKEHGPFAGWTPVNYADDHLLWRHADSRASLWLVDAQGNHVSYKEHGPYAGWTPIGYSDDHLLWRHTDGRASLWLVDAQGNHVSDKEHGPHAGWTPVHYADGRLLWRHTDGRASLWRVDVQGNPVSYKEHGPHAGWLPVHCDADTLTWRHVHGGTSVWTIDEQGQHVRYREFGPPPSGGLLVAQRTAVALQTPIRLVIEPVAPAAPAGPTPQIQYFPVEGPIAAAWQATGGEAGPLGAARSLAAVAADGETLAQRFVGGGVTHHAARGAAILRSERLYGDWHRQAALLGPPHAGDFLASAERLACERGVLLRSAGGLYFVVEGWTYLCHWRHGAAVGRPTGPAVQETGYTRQGFDHGVIIAVADDSFFLPHAFAEAWAAAGGAKGPLGLPVADLLSFQEGGTVVRFQGGALVAGPAGVVTLTSRFLGEWETRLGGPGGTHGLPITGEQTSAKGATWVDFERGCLILTPAKAWLAPRSLTVRVARIAAYGDDGGAGNQDLYLIADITASTGQPLRLRLPEGGTSYGTSYGTADVQLDRDLLTIPAVRGDLRLDLRFEGWDCDRGNAFGGDDDHLGTVHHVLTIDELWGHANPGRHPDRDFSIDYAVQLELTFDPNKFRQDMFWNFQNFTTDDLTYEQFARAFKGVDSDEDTGWNIFHHIFYECLRNRAESGNCFGMCLESIYAQLGASLYRPPLSAFGPPPQGNTCQKPAVGRDDLIMDQINVRHLYQFGAEQMLGYLLQSAAQEDWDGPSIFQLSKYMHERNMHPLLYVYTDSLFGDGHVVRPYAWAADGSHIRLANPNAPHPHFEDTHAWSTLAIDKATGDWKLAEGRVYAKSSGGRIVAVPSTALLSAPTVPSAVQLIQLASAFVGLWLGSAAVEQVTDDVGRTLFAEGRAPQRWSDLRPRAERIPNFLPCPPLAGDTPAIDPQILAAMAAARRQCFVGRGRPRRLTYRAAARGGAVRFVQLSGRLAAQLSYDALAAQRDEVTVTAGGPEAAGVHVKPGGARVLEMTLGTGRRAWRVRGLELGGAAQVEVQVRDDGRRIALQSAGAPVAFDLDRLVGKQFVACADRSELRLDPSQQLEIREEPASALSAALVDRASLTLIRKWTL